MDRLKDILKHHGVKGMRWGIRRNSNRPGGADGKWESEKIVDKRSGIGKRLDSWKRERQWSKALKQMHTMNTRDINKLEKRISLENNLKKYSKSKVGTKKDIQDYLRREKMSDQELSRKVTRLRAKSSLYDAVKKASKEQREFGEKVVNIGSSIGVKYALGKKPGMQDIFDVVNDPKKSARGSRKDLTEALLNKSNLSDGAKKTAKDILDKAYSDKKSKS